MNRLDKNEKNQYLFKKTSSLNGVGNKIKNLLKKKGIEKISDLLLNFPQYFTDRSNLNSLNNLEIGKVATIKVNVVKYNFPRIRNLPSKVMCNDEKGQIDIVFFNSREGYIRKILPINNQVIISGKVTYFKKKYQITNPEYVVPLKNEKFVRKNIPKYSLTEGLNEKVYRKLIEQVLKEIPDLKEWHNKNVLEKIGNVSWLKSIYNIHEKNGQDLQSIYYRRLVYDEILSNLLFLSKIRKKVKKLKKIKKFFNENDSKKIIKNLKYTLTNDQTKCIKEINTDLKSNKKMFRILQGDVGAGKTIVCLIAAYNVIKSNSQAVLMAPTEILAKQHYDLALKIFNKEKIKITLLTGKMKINHKNIIQKKLSKGIINLLIGTHSVFQSKIEYKNLGLIIIDEQHKFGVKQRIALSKKGGKNCDILLMSATPIPRTLIMTAYGDMDISKIYEKPKNRKEIITLSKPDEKMNEILLFIKEKIKTGNQIFWVCPLIEESKILDYEAAVKKYNYLLKIFNNKVGLIHGSLNKDDKNIILNKFLNKEIDILVSTTVIEVGIDFPNANIIVIENSNKFGLSQLHQLRGRVGRGINQGTCILVYKKNLSQNAKKRIKILKSTNDGFQIAEEDMKLRGYGDILGFQQSGIKNFKIADPIHHADLFDLAEKDIKNIEQDENNLSRYEILLKLFDKVEALNDKVSGES